MRYKKIHETVIFAWRCRYLRFSGLSNIGRVLIATDIVAESRSQQQKLIAEIM
jgi:hypothetical protein